MKREDCGDWLREAWASVREVRRVLAAPTLQALDRCHPCLEKARSCLEALRGGLAPYRGDPKLLGTAHDLRRELSQLMVLLEEAVSFHRGWIEVLGVMAGGYTAQGGVTPWKAAPRVSLEG